MKTENHSLLISIDAILDDEMKIIKGEKFLLNVAAAKIFEIDLKQLQQKIKTHRNRFPKQFMFQLNENEIKKIFQTGTKRKKIQVFNWDGLMMLAGLLKSKRAIAIHLQLVRLYGKGILDKINFGN
jgi:phage regulator Rha-like protein